MDRDRDLGLDWLGGRFCGLRSKGVAFGIGEMVRGWIWRLEIWIDG